MKANSNKLELELRTEQEKLVRVSWCSPFGQSGAPLLAECLGRAALSFVMHRCYTASSGHTGCTACNQLVLRFCAQKLMTARLAEEAKARADAEALHQSRLKEVTKRCGRVRSDCRKVLGRGSKGADAEVLHQSRLKEVNRRRGSHGMPFQYRSTTFPIIGACLHKP